MANFSDEGYLQIKSDPLQPRIRHLRDSLCSAIQRNEAESPATDHPSEDKSILSTNNLGASKHTLTKSGIKDAISNLIATLQVHTVAKTLRTRDGKPLNSELGLLYGRITADNADVQPFLPFATLVADNGPDVDTWKAVLDLIAKFQHTTPDRSIEPSFGGTPRTYSSAPHQGSEQTRRLLDAAIKQELRDCTYRHVDGFWEKYFDGQPWVTKTEHVYKKIRDDGSLASFPRPPSEEAVWKWWSDIQKKHLQGLRGVYYTTASKKDLKGTDSERQLDLLVKHGDVSPEGKHHWGDVRVVGEHKASQANPSTKFFQLARYVRDVFATQPTRRFVHGFLLLGSSMELYVFDRSGAYGATPFDIHEEPERFIRAMSAYVLMSDKELGLDTFIECEDGRQYVTLTDNGRQKGQRLELEAHPIAVQAAIVCRGTSCYRRRRKTVRLTIRRAAPYALKDLKLSIVFLLCWFIRRIRLSGRPAPVQALAPLVARLCCHRHCSRHLSHHVSFLDIFLIMFLFSTSFSTDLSTSLSTSLSISLWKSFLLSPFSTLDALPAPLVSSPSLSLSCATADAPRSQDSCARNSSSSADVHGGCTPLPGIVERLERSGRVSGSVAATVPE